MLSNGGEGKVETDSTEIYISDIALGRRQLQRLAIFDCFCEKVCKYNNFNKSN